MYNEFEYPKPHDKTIIITTVSNQYLVRECYNAEHAIDKMWFVYEKFKRSDIVSIEEYAIDV